MIYRYIKELFDKSAVLKAAYNFTDKAYIHLDVDNQYYVVEIKGKNDISNITEDEFENEVLAQMVRLDIQKRTRNVRELLLARALSSTLIEDEMIEEECEKNDEIMINDILQDWFEKYE